MIWLKGLKVSTKIAWAAFLLALTVMAAKRQKANANKWHDKATDIELGNVIKGTTTARAASTQAKLHDAKADEIKAKAVARIDQMGDQDEDVKDILARWGT